MRLNKNIRANIAQALLAHRFDKHEKQLKAEEAELFLLIWEDIHSAADRALMEKAPEGAFTTAQQYRVNFGGVAVEIRGLEEVRTFAKWPNCNGWIHRDIKAYSPQDDVYKVWEKWHNKTIDLRNDKEAARVKISSTLASFASTKRLVQEWPEIAPFLPKEIGAGLPMVPVQQLNAILDLP